MRSGAGYATQTNDIILYNSPFCHREMGTTLFFARDDGIMHTFDAASDRNLTAAERKIKEVSDEEKRRGQERGHCDR